MAFLLRRIGLVLAGLIGLVVLAAGGAALWIVNADFRPLIEREAGAALDRRMTVGSLTIGWRNPLALELRDVRIANMPGGSEPDMMRFGRVLAEINLSALLRGVMHYERLILEQPMILLERHENGDRNWRFPGGASPDSQSRPPPKGGLDLVPKNRTQFPTLVEMSVADGLLIYRSQGRRDIRLDFRSFSVRSSGDDSAVSLAVEGAYNGAPVRIEGTTDSFARMRDDAQPFGTQLKITAAGGTLGFRGTMAEPTDFEGVLGPLHIETADLGRFLALFGVEMTAPWSFQVDGAFDKQGERWKLGESRGQVAGNRFTGDVTLDEGARGQPDAIVTALRFPRLDVATLTGKPSPDQKLKPESVVLRPDEKPGAIVDARLQVAQLLYDAATLADVSAELRTRPGDVTLSRLAFGVGGGRIETSGRLRAVAAGGQLAARMRVSGAEIGEVLALLGTKETPIRGKADALTVIEMTGETLADGLKANRSQTVVSLRGGQLSRDLLEKASVDLRTLFRAGEGWVPLDCMFGVIDLRDGLAKLAPVRLHTPRTTLRAAGFIDLPSAQLDMVLRAESDVANAAALKLPIKIAGPIANPRVGPAFGSLVRRLDEPDPAPAWMAPELTRLVERTRCPR